MESFLISGICRCCASEGPSKNLTNKYKWMGDEEVYSEMLKDCFDVTLHSTDDPATNGGICEVCITQLRNAYNFKKQVIVTEEFFKRRLLDGEHTFTADIKLEVDRRDCSASENDIDAADDLDSEMSVKSEQDEEKPKRRKVTARASTSRAAKKVKAEDAKSTPRQEMPKRATKVTQSINSKKKLTHTDNTLLVVDKTESPEVDSKQHLKKLINQSYKDGVDAQSAKPNDRKDKRKRLENLQTVLLCSNASLIQGKDNGGYRCSLCPHKFPESSELKTHFSNRHRNVDFIMRLQAGMFERSTKLDVTFLRCSLCNAELDKLDDLKAHLQMEHGKVIHNDVTNYMVPFKFEKPGFHCVECAAEFGEFKPLFEHMHHHYRNYVCDQCDAGFVTKNARNSHQARHGYGTYSCLQCDKTFPSAQHLSSHVTRVHDKVKMSRCHLCLEKFTDIFKKAQHTEEVHGIVQPKAVCSACSREFKNHRSLKIHVKRDHLMERRHKCEFCEKAFYTGSQLKHHAIKHIDAPKSFKCSMCPKAYDRRKTLMNHMRSHTELLQFHCQMCDKEFMSQVGVDYHVKMKHSAATSS